MEFSGGSKSKEDQPFKEACEHALEEMNCDFVGLALQNRKGPDISWHYAAGNRNDKYKRITVRYGKGIAGKVISTGRPMKIEGFPNNIHGKALEYPIMLAENLNCAFAVPIHFKGVPKGVLLVGKRTDQPISESDQHTILDAAKKLEKEMNSSI
ncbi:GAF domain-containing protein [Peribacillus sp. NJ4]|uniref:GAF domain-containing protein n=1 Tax=Peribacillus TaxID=2675229 RepID=UPI0025A09135|nr:MULTISPECIES: GAF domain-containing protein [unclassified Peribacillus]MDM5212863.1 GAF domain-containing protein [Peribacillus sp. NJ4]MDM5223254.1 GAF domain-containing protein [Peribacillus sp. NJ11]